MESIDLFEYGDNLPNEVLTIIRKFDKGAKTYHNCKILVERLNKIGYTCDYGLDAEPFNLKKL